MARLHEGLESKLSVYNLWSPSIALTLDDDIPGLNGDLDPLGDFEQFLGVAIAQLSVRFDILHGCMILFAPRSGNSLLQGNDFDDRRWVFGCAGVDGMRTCTSS